MINPEKNGNVKKHADQSDTKEKKRDFSSLFSTPEETGEPAPVVEDKSFEDEPLEDESLEDESLEDESLEDEPLDDGASEMDADSAEVRPLDAQSRQKDPDERAWYVLRVQSGREDRIKINLEKRVAAEGLQDKIFQVVVPSERVSEIRKGSKRIVNRKLYPGYVMIEMIRTEETHYLVKSTPGVGDFAGTMSDMEVERMLMTYWHSKDKPKPKVSFRKGQSIKIKEGAFENYDGIVDEVNEQKGIIKVRIGIFGRYTQVELGFWQVESL